MGADIRASVIFSLVGVLGSGAIIAFGAAGYSDWVAPWMAAMLAGLVMLCVGLAVAVVVLARDRQRLRHDLSRSELSRLRTQINPHFLYNTLSAISELCYLDAQTADRLITQLSGLLRKALSQSDLQEIPLSEELEFVLDYIAIQQALMRERLTADIDVDPQILAIHVPGMIAQPLVENAVMHGLDANGCCALTLRARRRGNELVLEVGDRGGGLRSRGQPKLGVGILNTRTRLNRLYGLAGRLTIEEKPTGGVLARLVIPVPETKSHEDDESDHRRRYAAVSVADASLSEQSAAGRDRRRVWRRGVRA